MCGPDITAYVVAFCNDLAGAQITSSLISYVTSSNADQVSAAVLTFGMLINDGDIWDFKQYIVNYSETPNTLLAVTADCPSANCPNCAWSLTISGVCFDYTVPGYIIFGYIGSFIGFSQTDLLAMANLAYQFDNNGQSSPATQVSAIQCGCAIFAASNGSAVTVAILNAGVEQYASSMLQAPSGCNPCSTTWSGSLP